MKLQEGLAAVVTGGGSGLGEATARGLAARGGKVALFDMNLDAATRVADEIGGIAILVGVTDDAAVEAAFATAREAHGQERMLVNCAGVATGDKTGGRDKATGAIVAHRLDRFRRTIEINLIGTFASAARRRGWRRRSRTPTGSAASSSTPQALRQRMPSWAGRERRVEGRRRWLDAAGRTRPDERWHPSQHDPARHPGDPDAPRPATECAGLARGHRALPEAARRPREYAATALFLIENGYMNGATVRLDGALRLSPR